MIAIIFVDGAENCSVAIARVDWHLQAAEVIAPLGEYPEPLASEVAALIAHERGLPIAGPLGIAGVFGARHDG